MTMTDDSAFILTRIAELTRDLDLAHMIQDISIILFIIGFLMIPIGNWLYWNFWCTTKGGNIAHTGLILMAVASIGYICAYLSIPLTESELDSLIMAYEALYGPLPEGML